MRARAKGKFHQTPCREGTVGTGRALLFSLYGSGLLTPRPGHITPGKDPVSHLQEAG